MESLNVDSGSSQIGVLLLDKLTTSSALQIRSTREAVCTTILDKPKESRHNIKNKTTDYLDYLESEWNKNIVLLEHLSQLLETSDASIKDEYIDKIWEDIFALNCELEKLNKIVVIDNEHISIWSFVHRLWVYSLTEDNAKTWIVNANWQTFFNHRAATSLSKQLSGYKLYTQRELETLIDAIPGQPLWNQIQILLDLLQIPLAWDYSYEDNSVDNINNTVHLWTSTRIREHWEELYTKCIIDKEESEYPVFEEDSADNFALLIVHKEKKKRS